MKIYQNIEANIRDINKEVILLNVPAPGGLLLDHGVSFHVAFHFLAPTRSPRNANLRSSDENLSSTHNLHHLGSDSS